MTLLSPSEVQELASKINFPCVSLYMPAEKAGAETRKNSIRFKNLLSTAEERLEQLGSSGDLTEHLDSAKSYIDNHDFWQHQKSGLVFFIGQQGIKYYTIERNFNESAVVSDRFYLKPLLQTIHKDTKFYLLALSQNQVRFFSGDRDNIKELNLPESVPPSLAEALKYDDPEKQTQYHSGDSGSNPIYHGQGVGTTDNKDEIRRFFQQIDSGLQAALGQEQTPLILAGVEYLLPIYQETNSYSNLLEADIPGNPENVAIADLHSSAWEIIQHRLATAEKEAIAQYNRLANTAETTNLLAEIIPAAVNGQINTLFVTADAQQWGSFDSQNNQVAIHEEYTKESVDLYDLAVTNTYIQGGQIHMVDSETMPENTSMMAILRYPVYAEAEKVTV